MSTEYQGWGEPGLSYHGVERSPYNGVSTEYLERGGRRLPRGLQGLRAFPLSSKLLLCTDGSMQVLRKCHEERK